MIGIFLITHGTFGESLIQNACHVQGRRPPFFAQLGLAAQDDPSDLLPLAQRLLEEVDAGEGVLVMTDICGASPANLALRLLRPGHVEGVSGLNLPMLLRALTYREKGMETMIAKAISGACDGVVNMSRDV
ncbi:MAG: PTS fructose transporter subunit IIA [Betaproteobacteria bacterium]|nr:PTS fructose transporter subunit IIA [Betaproteobacteria bacterium]